MQTIRRYPLGLRTRADHNYGDKICLRSAPVVVMYRTCVPDYLEHIPIQKDRKNIR
jgi:hypothetical protein